MAKKKKSISETPSWQKAVSLLWDGPFHQVYRRVHIYCSNTYSMAKGDWAYVTSDGSIYLNPSRTASPKEWEFIISLCMVHLGFGHFVPEKVKDPLWVIACDLVAARFLRDSQIGTPPPEFSDPYPFPVGREEQVYSKLTELRGQLPHELFSMMTNGRPDIVWTKEAIHDYPSLFVASLQDALRASLDKTIESTQKNSPSLKTPYHKAQQWFISSYPLLGALAASFRMIDDYAIVRRLEIPVAAVCPEMQEIYINPTCRLTQEEWKFVLAHEFLHTALRHDMRREERDPVLWNVACDYVVNLWLCEMDIGSTPEFILLDQSFRGMSVESVYDLLTQDIRYYRKKDPKDLVYGGENWWDTLDGSEVDAMYRSALQRGLEYHNSNGRGYLPSGLVEEIYAVSRSPIPWDVQLAQWFDEHFSPLEPRRTYSRLSRRQSASPEIPRPAWYRPEEVSPKPIFGVLLDTSGSMDRHLLAAALGSIASYSQARDVNHVRVVFCDAMAYDQGIMSPDEIAGAVKVRGRGGTRLQPGIDLLNHDPSFPKDAPLLVITDGECDRLSFAGRSHAFLIPSGCSLPFHAKGPVFRLR